MPTQAVIQYKGQDPTHKREREIIKKRIQDVPVIQHKGQDPMRMNVGELTLDHREEGFK